MLGHMGSIAMCGKSVVGGSEETIMPSEGAKEEASKHASEDFFEAAHEPALEVSPVYGYGPEVMDRKK